MHDIDGCSLTSIPSTYVEGNSCGFALRDLTEDVEACDRGNTSRNVRSDLALRVIYLNVGTTSNGCFNAIGVAVLGASSVLPAAHAAEGSASMSIAVMKTAANFFFIRFSLSFSF